MPGLPDRSFANRMSHHKAANGITTLPFAAYFLSFGAYHRHVANHSATLTRDLLEVG